MLNIRYVVVSVILITSGIYIYNYSDLAYADVDKSQDKDKENEKVLENTMFNLNKPTANLYLQQLAEMSAYEAFGQPVKVVIE